MYVQRTTMTQNDAMYSPLPNIRPGPNYRLVGDEGSELIRDQDLFTNHLG